MLKVDPSPVIVSKADKEGESSSKPSKMNKKGVPSSSTATATQTQTQTSWLRWCCLELPLVMIVSLWAATYASHAFYMGPLQTLIESFRRSEDSVDELGYYTDFFDDLTYYGRHCDARDITTKDSNDLIVPPDASSQKAADIMMTHGAVLIQNLLTNETATKLRDYLETRHDIKDRLPWHEKFFGEIGRLSLGLGVDDDPIVAKALEEVGTNPVLQTTLEGIVGPDPAIVEISTLTTLHGAQSQGIHTDSDYFGSSLLYSRTFLHSYTLFMALQDTTSKMGATTICPGTQWCANEDLGDVCLPSREVMDQQQNNNHAFEVSSNGKTGRDVGLLYQGDGMMFNQNIWHRGPRNNDKDRIMNRVMFIVTFVSRQDHDLHMTGDVRQQGLGTYYYQRWNMWGHTYDDLKSAATRMAQPIAALRALGIWKMPSTQWGIPWLEHFARQLANDEDFFSDYELPDFLGFLDGVGVPRWLQGRRAILKEDSYQSQRERRELERLAREEDEELDWESFLIQLATNIKDLVDSALSIALAWYFIVNTTAIAVTQRGAGGFLKRTLMTFFVSGIFWMGLWHYVTQVSHLGKRIQMRDTWRQPFPEPPLTLDHLQRTTFPTRDDVLVGSRFDAAYLSSFNNVLDYHPGNLEFQTALQDLGSPDLIQAYMNQPVQGVTPRFLQQDWKTGFWSLMTHQKTKDYIARQVHTSQHLLVGRLDEHLKSVLADARFGLSRETIMAKKFTSQLAMEWQSVLYRNLISTDEEKEKRFTTTTTKPSSTKQSTLSVPKSTICSIPTAIDAPFIPKTTSTLLLRSVGHGDRVLALLGPSGQYLEATIGLAMTDDMVSVEFTMLNEMGMVPKDSIRPFARFVQGGLAQVPYFYGADDYDADDWRLVEILSINPFLGDATVRHLEADDDVDEEGRIVRDLNVEFIRRLPFSSSSSLSMSKLHYNLPLYELDEGDQVQARFGGNGEWFSARIDQVHSDGTFGVAYDDGDFEEHVALYHIKPTGVVGGKMKRNKNKKQTPVSSVSSFRPGQRVMCLYENDNETKEWFPATIVKDHENGTYHVYYDDEESAYEVPLDEIRLLPEAMDGGEID